MNPSAEADENLVCDDPTKIWFAMIDESPVGLGPVNGEFSLVNHLAISDRLQPVGSCHQL